MKKINESSNDESSNDEFIKLKNVNFNKSTMLSYGGAKYKNGKMISGDPNKINGCFNISIAKLKKICECNKYFEKYALVEKKTEYYKLMFDIDFKEKNVGFVEYESKINDITQFILDVISKSLKHVFCNPDTSYVYCDKNKGTGIHLYYPNIIVNIAIHEKIMNLVFSELYNDTKFKLTSKIWNSIFDECISKANGLRLLYFIINGAYYKINKSMSTYKNIPKSKSEQVKLCTIRTDNNNHYPKKILIDIEVSKTKKRDDINTNKKEITKFVKIDKIKVDELDNLLSCFSEDRFTEYMNWHRTAWIIYNSNNSEEACKLFYKYSKIGKYYAMNT